MDFQTWPRLLVVDVEGNGANPPDLIEVATIPITGGRVEPGQARSWLIRPPQPITSFAARVHGLTNAALADAPDWSATAPEVLRELDGAWIAAHNAGPVEYRVLKAHMPDWEPTGVIDTLRLARAVYTDAPKHNLDALIAHTGIDVSVIPGARHRAGFDAHATALLLLDLAGCYDDFDALIKVGVPAGLPGEPKGTTPPEPEAHTLW